MIFHSRKKTKSNTTDSGNEGDGDEVNTPSTSKDTCVVDSSSDREDDDCETQSTCEPSAKKRKRMFVETWKDAWGWLDNRKDGMQCSLCMKHGQSNTMTKRGCFNFKTTTHEN